MGSIGLPELLIVLFVVLLILGPKRLPALGRSVGGGLRDFKDSITKKDTEPQLPAADTESDRDPITGEVVSEPRR